MKLFNFTLTLIIIIMQKKPKMKMKLVKSYNDSKIQLPRTYYISIGENCLTDNILERHGFKSFSTVYSHGRSNIDYAIQLESEQYSNLLKKDFLYYDKVGVTNVVRNNHYSSMSKIFNEDHDKGFEFTHHNVIKNEAHIESIRRKVARLKKHKGKKNFNFFYHYRVNSNMSIETIFKRAETFLKFYEINNKKCEFIIFTQNIVHQKEHRGVEKIEYTKNIKAYIFNTLDVWGGLDQDTFWARNDDDLIAEIFMDLK